MEFHPTDTNFTFLRIALAGILLGVSLAYSPGFNAAVVAVTYVVCEATFCVCRFAISPPISYRMTLIGVAIVAVLGAWTLGLRVAVRYDAMRTGLPPSLFAYAIKSNGRIVAVISNQLDTRAHNAFFDFQAITGGREMSAPKIRAQLLDRKITTTTNSPLDVGKYFVLIEADEGRWSERMEIEQDAAGNLSALIVMLNDQGETFYEKRLP